MGRVPHRIVAGFLLASALACANAPDSQQPPSGSYTPKTLHVGIDGVVTTVRGASVIPDFFKVARVPILLGRQFVEADHDSDAAKVAILSHEAWKERFASMPNAIGRSIDIDGVPTTIVGVTGAGYRFRDSVLIWLPARR
jgi:hypothetical protein